MFPELYQRFYPAGHHLPATRLPLGPLADRLHRIVRRSAREIQYQQPARQPCQRRHRRRLVSPDSADCSPQSAVRARPARHRAERCKYPARNLDLRRADGEQHEAKEVKLFDQAGRVFIHPSSILFSEAGFKSGFLAYFQKAETSKVFLRDATEVCNIS